MKLLVAILLLQFLYCHPTLVAATPASTSSCSDNYDAIDLAPDNKYYFFAGDNLFTVEKLKYARSEYQPIATVFEDVIPPVIAAFSTGPLNGRMYIIDSDLTNNVKIFKCAAADTLPRKPVSIGSLSIVFPQAANFIPQPLQAAFVSFSPTRVFFIGGRAGNRTVGMYNFQTNTQAFTGFGMSSVLGTAWDVDVKTATTHYNPQNGTLSYHLQSSSETTRVDTALKITYPPTGLATCPDWQPYFFSSCCSAPAIPTSVWDYAYTGATVAPARFCGGTVDSIDLAADNRYYFFSGPTFYTVHKLPPNNITDPRLITSVFPTVKYPVVAAFTIGPLNSRTFIVDSDHPNNTKMYRFDLNPSPTLLRTGRLSDFFPNADRIPHPLTAALASFIPSRVLLFGGPPGTNQTVAIYSFNTMSTTFTPVEGNTTLSAKGWQTDITAAVMYYFSNNGSTALYAFNHNSAARVRPDLQVIYGPDSTSNCEASWLPKALKPTCCDLITTLAPPEPTTNMTQPTTTTIQPTTNSSPRPTSEQTTSAAPPGLASSTTELSTNITRTPFSEPWSPPKCAPCHRKFVVLEGWHAVASHDTVITLPETKSAERCLQQCRVRNAACRLISFNIITQTCLGFTGRALPEFKRDFDGVMLAMNRKVCRDQGVCIPDGLGEETAVEQTGHAAVCMTLCRLHPRCVRAEWSGMSKSCAMTVCKNVRGNG